VVSHDIGFRPAVTLPAVAILFSMFPMTCLQQYLTRHERGAALWKPLYFYAHYNVMNIFILSPFLEFKQSNCELLSNCRVSERHTRSSAFISVPKNLCPFFVTFVVKNLFLPQQDPFPLSPSSSSNSQATRSHGFAVRWQERQARAVLGENIARATVERRLRRVDSRLGHARHTMTERARAAQIQAFELGARRECFTEIKDWAEK